MTILANTATVTFLLISAIKQNGFYLYRILHNDIITNMYYHFDELNDLIPVRIMLNAHVHWSNKPIIHICTMLGEISSPF